METYNFVQGYPMQLEVPSLATKLVLKSDNQKIVSDHTEIIDGKAYITLDQTITSGLVGEYYAQLLNSDGIANFKVEFQKNYKYSQDYDSPKSKWLRMREAIEDRLSTDVPARWQAQFRCGDKSISSMSVSELTKLLDFVNSKLAEEEGTSTKNDGHKILYKWSLR